MRGALSGIIGTTGALLLLVGVSGAEGQVEVSGNVAITNDYAFRGISQTLEEPAVQGGLDARFPADLYLGVWGSSVNFGEDLEDGPRAQMELDVYGGIAPSFGPLDFDFGALYYAYPGASNRDYNFWEAYAGLGSSVGPVSVGVNGAYSPEFYLASGDGVYGAVDLSFGIPDTPVTLDGTVGHQWIEIEENFGTPDYLNWSAGATVDVLGVGIGAGLTGTNLDKEDCFNGMELCGTRVIVSIGREL